MRTKTIRNDPGARNAWRSNLSRSMKRSVWNSEVRLGERFFRELIRRPMPVDFHMLRAEAQLAGPRPLHVAQLPALRPRTAGEDRLAPAVRPVRTTSGDGDETAREGLQARGPTRARQDPPGLARVPVRDDARYLVLYPTRPRVEPISTKPQEWERSSPTPDSGCRLWSSRPWRKSAASATRSRTAPAPATPVPTIHTSRTRLTATGRGGGRRR